MNIENNLHKQQSSLFQKLDVISRCFHVDVYNIQHSLLRSFILMSLLLVSVFLSSCTYPITEDELPVYVSPTVSSISNAPYQPAGGSLQLFHGVIGSEHTSVFNFSDTRWHSATPIYWHNLKPLTGSAKYVFFAVSPLVALATNEFSVNSDQSDQSDYLDSDQLVAYSVSDKILSSIPLKFKHVLSQVKITLEAKVKPTDPDYLDPARSTLFIVGASTSYTLNFDNATVDIPAVAVVSSTKALSGIIPFSSGGSFYAMLPAQTFPAHKFKFVFTIGLIDYEWENEDPIVLEFEKTTNVRLQISKSGIDPDETIITLADWVSGDNTDETVVVD